MRRFAPAVLLAIGLAAPALAQEVLGPTGIKGAGSTFAYPVVSAWSQAYRRYQARGGEFPAANGGLEDPPASTMLDYEPVGSLAGLLRVKEAAVDFGATDVAIAPDELARLGLAQFPLVIGGVVAAVNIDGLPPGELKLTGAVLADIYLGRITRWSDSALKALNPRLQLPDAPIAVIVRSDGSGTTYNFADYLSKSSADFRSRIPVDFRAAWPTGAGFKGNEGVANAVRRTRNSIGYVEYAQAVRSRLDFAQVRNRAGQFVKPAPAAFAAAAAGAGWEQAGDFALMLTDPPGEAAYPIVATVFIVMSKSAPPRRARAAFDFFQWSLERGGAEAARLGYVPLPPTLVERIKSYWAKNFRA